MLWARRMRPTESEGPINRSDLIYDLKNRPDHEACREDARRYGLVMQGPRRKCRLPFRATIGKAVPESSWDAPEAAGEHFGHEITAGEDTQGIFCRFGLRNMTAKRDRGALVAPPARVERKHTTQGGLTGKPVAQVNSREFRAEVAFAHRGRMLRRAGRDGRMPALLERIMSSGRSHRGGAGRARRPFRSHLALREGSAGK